MENSYLPAQWYLLFFPFETKYISQVDYILENKSSQVTFNTLPQVWSPFQVRVGFTDVSAMPDGPLTVNTPCGAIMNYWQHINFRFE